MRTGYKVCDAMTEKPVMVDKNVSLMDCATAMKDNKVGSVIIEDKDDFFIMTERDIVRKGTAIGVDPEKTPVETLMSPLEHTIEPHKDIYDAMVVMRDNNIRHLPVSDGSKMIGLLTLKDILKIEPQLFDILAEKIKLKEEIKKPAEMGDSEGVCNLCGKHSDKVIAKGNLFVCEPCSKEN
jgi:signal-transduction protein with cAMP-binding, CBS, and nucleotidyltransferase domain|tara:strand:+ start:254 stop:796 length:543 start_codon:yes stop_codon:yes gene_type:complete